MRLIRKSNKSARKSNKSNQNRKGKGRGNWGARLPFGGGELGLLMAIFNPGVKLA